MIQPLDPDEIERRLNEASQRIPEEIANLRGKVSDYAKAYAEEFGQAQDTMRDIAKEANALIATSDLAAATTIVNIATHGTSEGLRLKAAMYIYDRNHPTTGSAENDPLAQLVKQLTATPASP